MVSLVAGQEQKIAQLRGVNLYLYSYYTYQTKQKSDNLQYNTLGRLDDGTIFFIKLQK